MKNVTHKVLLRFLYCMRAKYMAVCRDGRRCRRSNYERRNNCAEDYENTMFFLVEISLSHRSHWAHVAVTYTLSTYSYSCVETWRHYNV